MNRGGRREGAGRKPGSLNRKHVDLLKFAADEGITPVEHMLQILRDDGADPADRRWAAEKAAPYLHPRPAPVQRSIKIDLPEITKSADLTKATHAILEATASGQVIPAEAQQLSAIVEAHRKAIETTELIERIERLEAKKPKE